MAKASTKHSKKNIDKDTLSKRLEEISHNVARKGMFFSTTNTDGTYNIVDAKTKSPVILGLLDEDLAQLCASRLNKVPQNQLQQKLMYFKRQLVKYHSELEKHYNDIFFYKHTLRNTNDSHKYFVVQTRLDLALQHFSKIISRLRGIFYS